MPLFVIIGNPGCRRVHLFQKALTRFAHPPAEIISYPDLIVGRVTLPDRVTPGAMVRIESPGEDFATERLILAAGADIAAEDSFAALPREAALALPFDRGRIRYLRQWYLGYRAILNRIARQLERCPPHRIMNAPDDITVMFDKPACHHLITTHNLPVPPQIGPVGSYDELLACMQAAGCRRVFVKPAHGSSASGVVAYRFQGSRHMATTTVEMVEHAGELRLYNSLRRRTYTTRREIQTLIDALCHHRVHVERWIPKAGIENKSFDLRVLVIAGRVHHVVARLSEGPLTNLHLGNARAPFEVVRPYLPPGAWESARATCERVMALFPNSLYAGIDLLIAPGYRKHAVLEINAFGDLLVNVLWRGMDSYTAEILATKTPPANWHRGRKLSSTTKTEN